MPKKNVITETVADEVANAIRDARQLVVGITQDGQSMHDKLRALEVTLHKIKRMDDSPKLAKICERLARTIEISNMMERGSLQIEVQNETDACWQRLP